MSTSASSHDVPVRSDTKASFVTKDTSPPTTKTARDSGKPLTSLERAFSHVICHWRWEALCLILAILFQVAIVIIIALYNGKELPDWPYGININTIIAILGTFLRASLVVVLAEVISQAKWFWIDKSRPAEDMQVFDKASRGVSGSLSLIWLLRLRSWSAGTLLPTAAALITVLSLGTAPFSQQAIGTRTCAKVRQDATASLSAANVIPGRDAFHSNPRDPWSIEPGVGFKAAFINGLLNPAGNDSAPKFSCPTGNCDYGYGQAGDAVPLTTVAFCSKCIDVSHHVKNTKESNPGVPSYWIPFEGASVEENSTYMINEKDMSMNSLRREGKVLFQPMPWRSDHKMPDSFAEVARYAITNVTIMAFTESGNPDPKNSSKKQETTASECTLYACVQDFEAKVRDGRLEEHVLDTRPIPWSQKSHVLSPNENTPEGVPGLVKSPCVIDDQWYTYDNFSSVAKDAKHRAFVDYPHKGKNVSVPSDCLYAVSPPKDYYLAMNLWLHKALSGQCIFQNSGGAAASCNDTNWFPAGLYHGGNATHETMSHDFESLARVLTNFFRADGWSYANETYFGLEGYSSLMGEKPELPDNQQGFIRGIVWENTVCVEVSWPWLVYPSALCLFTTLLLFGIVMRSYNNGGVPPWKSSTLPLLLYSFVEYKPRFTEGSADYDGVAKTTTVRIRSVDEDMRVTQDASGRCLDRAEVDSLLDARVS